MHMDEIKEFSDNIECMSDVRKEFYKKIIGKRYDILKKIYENIKWVKAYYGRYF